MKDVRVDDLIEGRKVMKSAFVCRNKVLISSLLFEFRQKVVRRYREVVQAMLLILPIFDSPRVARKVALLITARQLDPAYSFLQ